MGGGGTWQIGLRHPELFAALAPVCAVADYAPDGQPGRTRRSTIWRAGPPGAALAENAAQLKVTFFHGDKDPTVPVARLAQDGRAVRQLGRLGKNVHYTEYPA